MLMVPTLLACVSSFNIAISQPMLQANPFILEEESCKLQNCEGNAADEATMRANKR